MKSKKTNALVLFSGGLDSILAVKILQDQGIKTTPLCFESEFFSCDKAREAAKENGIEIRIADISQKHWEIVKNPRYGRGAGANPCVDCHLLMLATAKEIMDREGFDLVATGEVMGQRPMSQNKLSMEVAEKQSELAGRLLRPLSAKLLPETEAEARKMIDRAKLYDFSGRSRRPQLALAARFGIKSIPQPAGGCVLTDPEYGRRLKELMADYPDLGGCDARLLRHGRVVRAGDLLAMIARDKNECGALKQQVCAGDCLFAPENFSGPTVLIRDLAKICSGKIAAPFEVVKKLGRDLVLRHSKKIPPVPKISIIAAR